MELIVLCIFLVIGPVDALVLRSLAVRPWQVSTACGFAGLLALAALIFAQLLTPNSSHLTVVRLSDQIDNHSCADTDLIAGSTFASTQPVASSSADEWWQAVPAPSAHAAPHDLLFHQTTTGNLPQPAGSIVLVGQRLSSSGPLLDGRLVVHESNGSRRITGSLRNLGPQPIRLAFIQTWEGVFALPLAPLEPQQTMGMDTPAGPSLKPSDPLLSVGRQLAARRSARVDSLLASHHDLACVYAQLESTAPAGVEQQDWVRALVPLAGSTAR